MATVKCRQGDLALGSSGFPKVPTTNTLAIHLPVSGLLGWRAPNCPWELQGRRTSLGNPGLPVWVGSGCRKIPPGQPCDVWLWHIPLKPFLVPVTPQSVCTHASAHTTWTKAQMKTHVGGHIHVDVYPHTYRGICMDAHACVCMHRDTHTREIHLIPSQGSSQVGHPFLPIYSNKDPSAVPTIPSGLDPAPAPAPSQHLQLPWPSCILSRVGPSVDSHGPHLISSAPVKTAMTSGLPHLISYTPSLKLRSGLTGLSMAA